MPPKNQFSKQDKLKMLEGLVIYSRAIYENILVHQGKLWTYALEERTILNADPNEDEVDMLCDDLFYEEFGVEPDEQAIEQVTKKIMGFDETVN
jgi:hypothetical protein